jgi:P4 family phage/plasmid primase-like protien
MSIIEPKQAALSSNHPPKGYQEAETMPPNNPILAAALAYAAEGWPVFPLQVRGKLPIIPKEKGGHGCLDATTDAEQIRAWWKEYPRANIGIATSAERAVLDVDKGHGGYESLADLEAEYGPLPVTRRARSGNGGLHIWFTGQGLKNKQGPDWGLPGLDWRGKGGYVVAPPSTLGPGKVYEWENQSAEIAPAPDWLIKRLTARPQRQTRAEQEGPAPRPGDDTGAFWLEKALQRATDGNRNSTGFWLACQLRDSGLSEQEAEHILLQYATRAPVGRSAYTDREALASVQSAYSQPARPPAKNQEPRPAGAGRSAHNERNHQGSRQGNQQRSQGAAPGAADGQGGENDQSGAPDEYADDTRPANTDAGNAQRLVTLFGADIRYCLSMKAWLIWNGRYWQTDEGDIRLMQMAKRTTRAMLQEAADMAARLANMPDEGFVDLLSKETTPAQKLQKAQTALQRWALASQNTTRLHAMIKLAQSEPGMAITANDLDNNPWLFNVNNGTIDLLTGQLQPHNKEHYNTRICPVDYDPKAGCPVWLRFLEQVLPDEETRDFMQLAFGYTLTGRTIEQCLFFLYGEGSNGKSTLATVLWWLMAPYGKKTRADTFMSQDRTQSSAPSPEIAELAGARLVEVSEIQEGHRLNEALIKDVTGGDPISARFLHCNPFTFLPAFKVWMYGNHKPAIRGKDDGIWRRVRIIPFLQQFKGTPEKPVRGYLPKDTALPDKLQAELPGILAWAVQGCLRWQKEGLPIPPSVAEATDAYRAEMDLLKDFIEDQCIIGRQLIVTKKALWEAYEKWAGLAGEQVYETQRAFNKAIAKRPGVTSTRTTGGAHIWRGLGLITDSPHDGYEQSDTPKSDRNDQSDRKSHMDAKYTHTYGDNRLKTVTSVTSVTNARDLMNAAPATEGTAALQAEPAQVAIQQEPPVPTPAHDALSVARAEIMVWAGRRAYQPYDWHGVLLGSEGKVQDWQADLERLLTPAQTLRLAEELRQPRPAGADGSDCVVAPAAPINIEAEREKRNSDPKRQAITPAILSGAYKGADWFNPEADKPAYLQALIWACGDNPSRIKGWSVPAVTNAFKDNGLIGLDWRGPDGRDRPLTARGFATELRKAYHTGNTGAVHKMAKTLGADAKLTR